jgi:hypothetical protein
MAQAFTYKRADRQVQTLNTITGELTPLGGIITDAELSNAFPNRGENYLCVFQGDPYFLYRSNANEVRLTQYVSGVWTDVVSFGSVTVAGADIKPLGLHVERDRLVAIMSASDSGVSDRIVARRSAQGDGLTWDPVVFQNFVAQPTNSIGGPSVVWRNAVFFTTSEGIGYYIPDTNTLSPVFDPSSGATLIQGNKANLGAFSFWRGDLYYILARDGAAQAPVLYKLDTAWEPTAPTALPAWTNQLVAIPAVGAVTIGNDTGNYSMFVNKLGEMSLLYSGTFFSKLVVFEIAGTVISAVDKTDALLPVAISGEPSLGFSFYADDRRRTNEQHTILVRFKPAVPVAVLVTHWDGVNPIEIAETLDDGGAGLDLMLSEDERGDFRTFTNLQPACYITATSDVFPGRTRVDYVVRDSALRPIDIFGEYSIDGQSWSPMTQGDGDDGPTGLSTSLAGDAHFFHWDAFIDLDGDFDFLDIRMIARIAGV